MQIVELSQDPPPPTHRDRLVLIGLLDSYFEWLGAKGTSGDLTSAPSEHQGKPWCSGSNCPQGGAKVRFHFQHIQFDLIKKQTKRMLAAVLECRVCVYMKLIKCIVTLFCMSKSHIFRLHNPEFSHVLPSGVLCKFKIINSDSCDIIETQLFY